MIETMIWAFFIAVPIVLVIAAVFAYIKTNQEVELDDELTESDGSAD